MNRYDIYELSQDNEQNINLDFIRKSYKCFHILSMNRMRNGYEAYFKLMEKVRQTKLR